MNVVSETATDAGMKVVKYDPTPMMSTYLVAFVVGELEFNEVCFLYKNRFIFSNLHRKLLNKNSFQKMYI